MQRLILLLSILLSSPGLLGLLVDGANQQRYERAPDDDPGWRNVGRRGSTSAIYLGRGWVLTARHSAMGEVTFGARVHAPVTDSMVWLDDPSGAKADLILFRIQPVPELPALSIRRKAPQPGAPVLMVGYGSGRGDAVTWSGVEGFRFTSPGTQRWGLNTIGSDHLDVTGPFETVTRCFQIAFGRNGVHEAFAGVGDSGGAVFAREPGGWRLAGVMLSVSRFPGQTKEIAVFGNATNAADLSVYASQILEAIDANTAAP